MGKSELSCIAGGKAANRFYAGCARAWHYSAIVYAPIINKTENQTGGSVNTQVGSLFYITVSGNSIKGEKHIENKESSLSNTNTNTCCNINNIAYNSYKTLCGNGNTIGDGIVPIDSAHLNNAYQININNEIHHSINNCGLDNKNNIDNNNNNNKWYGSNSVIDHWHTIMIEQFYQKHQKQRKVNNNNVFYDQQYESTCDSLIRRNETNLITSIC